MKPAQQVAEDKGETYCSWGGCSAVYHAAAFIEQARAVNMLMATSGWMIHSQRKGKKKEKEQKEEEFAPLQ